MKKCAKCKKKAARSIHTEGGEIYHFCKNCSEILESLPTGCAIANFLNSELTKNLSMI